MVAVIVGGGLEREAEEVGVVDFGAVGFVEGLGLLTAVATGEFEILATFGASPAEHGVPELTAYAFATDGGVSDEIFEIGVFLDTGAHDDGEAGDAEDTAVFLGDEEVVVGGTNDVFKPFARNFAFVFAASG